MTVHDEKAYPQRMFIDSEGESSKMALEAIEFEQEHARLQEWAQTHPPPPPPPPPEIPDGPWDQRILGWVYVGWDK
eukprot:5229154-Karenia_brevis.AAC.1